MPRLWRFKFLKIVTFRIMAVSHSLQPCYCSYNSLESIGWYPVRLSYILRYYVVYSVQQSKRHTTHHTTEDSDDFLRVGGVVDLLSSCSVVPVTGRTAGLPLVGVKTSVLLHTEWKHQGLSEVKECSVQMPSEWVMQLVIRHKILRIRSYRCPGSDFIFVCGWYLDTAKKSPSASCWQDSEPANSQPT
jgi:hypothetical protein